MNEIIIHGSTIGTNFGDFLLTKIFYEECNRAFKGDVLLYDNKFIYKSYLFELSPFYKNALNYTKRCTFKDVLKCKGIVFIPGGYFGETTSGLKEALVRFYRHVKLGLYAIILRKPLAILGIEAGPLSHSFLRITTKWIFNHASIISVRNEQSYEFLRQLGVTKPIIQTSDVAQIITNKNAKPLSKALDMDIQKVAKGRKIILLHCVMPKDEIEIISRKIVPALKRIVFESNCSVILTNDQCDYDRSKEMNEIAEIIGKDYCYIYTYHYPDEMIDLLNYVDSIITTKLHVGIIGCSLGKPVIAFPFNSTKIVRYYSQIGYSDRCHPIKDLSPEKAYSMIKEFKDQPITLEDKVRKDSWENIEYLKTFLSNI